MSIRAVTRLELRRLLVRPMAWALAALAIAWLAWTYVLSLGNFLNVQVKLAALADAPGFTDLVSVPLLAELIKLAFLVVPLLTMSLLAGERRAGTLPLLASTGIAPWKLIVGKYLAVLAWLAVWLIATLAMPLVLAGSTSPDWGKLAAATLGTALTLATLAAIGIACSAATGYPAIAAALALIVTLLLWTVDRGAQAAGVSGGFLEWLTMSTHLQNLLRGLVTSPDLIWFALAIALPLILAARRLSADRERH
ncbi:ABC-2 type transport system permease protein [Luteibacter rhizovicinus]|uniref:ABC-2 type transport system permease protein n=1 Tax=Luteibacter rhizovicinus TaxID=242606 RepID=A0A4R3YUE0_9GAMM|nr:ABC transporter permease subunit [Luteibacter rhizovicinus]TCV96211.1 ABC-2 type transport system permease protein [Luteibacter rhizovicinus]